MEGCSDEEAYARRGEQGAGASTPEIDVVEDDAGVAEDDSVGAIADSQERDRKRR